MKQQVPTRVGKARLSRGPGKPDGPKAPDFSGNGAGKGVMNLGRLDLQPLHTFFVAASSRTFTEAAERLHLSQSAVSHAIGKLERSLGIRLVERDHQPTRLTEAGEFLFRTCERVFHDLQQCREWLAQEAEGPLRGRLRIGATVEFGNSVLARRIAPFLVEHPLLEPSFTFSHELLKPLLADDLDVIIDCRPHPRAELTQIALFRERYVLVASPSLIREQRLRRLSDIVRVPWLTIDENGEWWQRLVGQLPPGTELGPRRLLPVNHLRGLTNLAIAGIGIGLVPAYCIQHEIREGWLRILFPDLQIREDRFSLFCKRLRRDVPKIRAFCGFMRRFEPEELGEAGRR